MSKFYFLTRSLFVGVGLSYFLNITGANILFPFIVSTILGIITLYFKSSNVNKIYALFICIFASTILMNLSHSLYLRDTSIFILSLFTFICSFLIGISNKKGLNKTALYLFFPCICLTILEFLLLLPSFSFDNIKNISPINFKSTIFSSLYLYIVSISPSFISNEKDKSILIKGYLIGMISIFLSSIFIIGSLGPAESMLYRYPEYIVLKKVHYSSFFTNVENIFFFSILMDLIITISTCINSFESMKEKMLFTCCCFCITIIICLKASFLSLIYLYMHIALFILFVLNFIKKRTQT